MKPSKNLNAEKALIFRVTHIDNVDWILQNGMHASSATANLDPDFVSIGDNELISKRDSWKIDLDGAGVLGDYIPFYFTPYSIMMYKIKTGHGGIKCLPNDDLVFFVSSIPRVAELKLRYLFTDQHAYTKLASFYSDISDLGYVDWELLQSRDFSRDEGDPGKSGRYQAEALIHNHFPMEACLGMACHNEQVKADLDAKLIQHNLKFDVKVLKDWYF